MPNITGLNKIYENKELAIASFGTLGEREISRRDDGKQILARYYDEEGNVASLIGIYHYKRTDEDNNIDYGNIEVKDYSMTDVEYITSIVEYIRDIEQVIEINAETVDFLRARLAACCGEPDTGDTPDTGSTDTPAYLTFTPTTLYGDRYVGLERTGDCNPKIFYSLDDGNTWRAWHEENYQNIPLGYRQTVKMYGDNPNGFSVDSNNYAKFVFGSVVEGGGELMALISEYPPEEIPNSWCFQNLFLSQPITVSPEMSATILKPHCYDHMFCDSSLNTPPSVLPAPIADEYSYCCMFKACGGLTATTVIMATELRAYSCEQMYVSCPSIYNNGDNIHGLSATTVGESCCADMFGGCTGLTSLPSVPLATVLAPYCYRNMFNNCSSAYDMPELPATELAEGCYKGMFSYCYQLTGITELPVETLKPFCYEKMFENCSMLEQAPELPAEILVESCYHEMFKSCQRLTCVKCLAMDISASGCTENWLYDVASNGLFIKAEQMEDWEIDSEDGIPVGWNLYQPLTFTILGDGNISWSASAADYTRTIYYSTDDGSTWNELTSNNTGVTFNVRAGDIVKFKGNNLTYGRSPEDCNTFCGSTATFEVSGYLTSLTSEPSCPCEPEIGDYAYMYMFRGCSGLTSAENLVLQKRQLTRSCYQGLFMDCVSLTNVPTLPATVLARACYGYMYKGCVSLVTIPSNYLPATTLSSWCYLSMFEGCVSLTTVPVLPATNMRDGCYQQMFYQCYSLGNVPSDYLPSTNLAYQCYLAMFRECSGMTISPDLPATVLATNCYRSMFMLTSITRSPLLAAQRLVDGCYSFMFAECLNIERITCLATDISAQDCTLHWVNGIASTGTFVKDANTTWPTGVDGIPNGWTVENY